MKHFNKKLLEVCHPDYNYYVQDNFLFATISDNLANIIREKRMSLSDIEFERKIFDKTLRIVECLEVYGDFIFYAGICQTEEDNLDLAYLPFKTKLALVEGLRFVVNYYNSLLQSKKVKG